MARIILIAMLTGVSPICAQEVRSEPASPVQPIATRQTSFAIPFSVRQDGELPKEVQLFVSTDRGNDWRMYESKFPTDKEFVFRADQDGEYWFAVRTIDRDGRPKSGGGFRPELVVLIDTMPPKLEFDAQIGGAGEVNASWRVTDENLLPDSLRVEFQSIENLPTENQPWQQVAIDAPRAETSRAEFSGQTTWLPKAAQGIRVRATARDMAGNVEEVNRRLFLPKNPVRPNQPDRSVYVPPSDPFQQRRQALPEQSYSDTDAATPKANPIDATGEVAPTNTQSGASSFARYRSDMNPSRRTELESTANNDGVARQKPWSEYLPDGERLRLTNSTRFNLQYDIDTVGPSGVAKVELWVTRNGGKTWENWGADVDRQSPFAVEVESEGVYGFRIAITSGIGFTSPPPSPGDLADIWIGVDQTKPTAEIVSVPFGVGNQSGQLIIEWTAHDRHLGEQPITLRFTDKPNGLWQTIATNLPNTGKFNWRVDPNVGQDIYLMLEVRDEAGNITTFQPPRPINIGGLRPRGHIKTFEPVGTANPR